MSRRAGGSTQRHFHNLALGLYLQQSLSVARGIDLQQTPGSMLWNAIDRDMYLGS